MAALEAWDLVMQMRCILLSVYDDAILELETLQLQPKTFTLLASIIRFPHPAELAKHLFVPPSTITFMVKQLEALGLLERQTEPGDLRRYRLQLTGKGRQAVTKGQAIVDRIMREKLSRLEKSEVKHLKEILSELQPKKVAS